MLKLRYTLPKYFNIDTVTLTFAAKSSLQVRNFTYLVIPGTISDRRWRLQLMRSWRLWMGN